MKTSSTAITLALSFLSACVASPVVRLEIPKLEERSKPTGGPGFATVTIYPSTTCQGPNSIPATPAGASFSITENTCTTQALAVGDAFSAKLTANPKTGTASCYVQVYRESNCAFDVTDEVHGFPFNGVATGNQVFCGQNSLSYAAFELVCG